MSHKIRIAILSFSLICGVLICSTLHILLHPPYSDFRVELYDVLSSPGGFVAGLAVGAGMDSASPSVWAIIAIIVNNLTYSLLSYMVIVLIARIFLPKKS